MKMVVGQKFNAFVHIAPFINVSKKRIIMQSFIKSQFGYGPLIWMFQSRGLTYNDESSSYKELLTKDSATTIHHRNITALAIELYKVIQGIPFGTSFLATTIWEIVPKEIKDSDAL